MRSTVGWIWLIVRSSALLGLVWDLSHLWSRSSLSDLLLLYYSCLLPLAVSMREVSYVGYTPEHGISVPIVHAKRCFVSWFVNNSYWPKTALSPVLIKKKATGIDLLSHSTNGRYKDCVVLAVHSCSQAVYKHSAAYFLAIIYSFFALFFKLG